jgi:hypothetical protein
MWTHPHSIFAPKLLLHRLHNEKEKDTVNQFITRNEKTPDIKNQDATRGTPITKITLPAFLNERLDANCDRDRGRNTSMWSEQSEQSKQNSQNPPPILWD